MSLTDVQKREAAQTLEVVADDGHPLEAYACLWNEKTREVLDVDVSDGFVVAIAVRRKK